MARASRHQYAPAIELTTCSVEDLIDFKSFAARGQDWVDVESIVKRSGRTLDWTIIDRELAPQAALKEQPEILVRLAEIRALYEGVP